MVEKQNKLLKVLLLAQGVYSLLTALWGLIDIESFMAITGPKSDVWLVKTVSVLIIPISLCLLSYLITRSGFTQVAIVGITSAIGLGTIDFYYSLRDVISKVYLGDGFMQVLFLLMWAVVIILSKGKKAGAKT